MISMHRNYSLVRFPTLSQVFNVYRRVFERASTLS